MCNFSRFSTRVPETTRKPDSVLQTLFWNSGTQQETIKSLHPLHSQSTEFTKVQNPLKNPCLFPTLPLFCPWAAWAREQRRYRIGKWFKEVVQKTCVKSYCALHALAAKQSLPSPIEAPTPNKKKKKKKIK